MWHYGDGNAMPFQPLLVQLTFSVDSYVHVLWTFILLLNWSHFSATGQTDRPVHTSHSTICDKTRAGRISGCDFGLQPLATSSSISYQSHHPFSVPHARLPWAPPTFTLPPCRQAVTVKSNPFLMKSNCMKMCCAGTKRKKESLCVRETVSEIAGEKRRMIKGAERLVRLLQSWCERDWIKGITGELRQLEENKKSQCPSLNAMKTVQCRWSRRQTDYTCYLFFPSWLMITEMNSLSQPSHLEMLLMPCHRRHYNNNQICNCSKWLRYDKATSIGPDIQSECHEQIACPVMTVKLKDLC